jgi:hypothetical protein
VSAASVPPKRRDYGMRDIDASDDWKVV